nr:hypothetical protein [Tanacetum cinerariifolium]
ARRGNVQRARSDRDKQQVALVAAEPASGAGAGAACPGGAATAQSLDPYKPGEVDPAEELRQPGFVAG